MTTARQPQANLADQLSLHARQRPTKPALVYGQEVLDYRTLELAVRQRAARLLDLGVQPGQIVGVALRDSMEHVLMLWAVTRAGATILPMDCRWTESEQQNLTRHFGAAAVMVEPGALLSVMTCDQLDQT